MTFLWRLVIFVIVRIFTMLLKLGFLVGFLHKSPQNGWKRRDYSYGSSGLTEEHEVKRGNERLGIKVMMITPLFRWNLPKWVMKSMHFPTIPLWVAIEGCLLLKLSLFWTLTASLYNKCPQNRLIKPSGRRFWENNKVPPSSAHHRGLFT